MQIERKTHRVITTRRNIRDTVYNVSLHYRLLLRSEGGLSAHHKEDVEAVLQGNVIPGAYQLQQFY